MSLIAQPKPGRWTTGIATARSFVGPVVGVLLLGLLAVFLGLFTVFMPPSITARLAFLMAGVLVVLLALLLSPGMAVPGRLVRRLLFAWILVSVVWPHYLSYHGLPGPGINPTRLVYWLLVAVWFFWLVGSRELRTLLAARLAQARPFIALLLAYLVWNVFCALFSQAPFFSLYHFIKIMGGPVLVLLIALSCLRDRSDIDYAMLLFVVAAVASVGVGLVEAVKQKNLFFDIVPSLFPQGGEGELAWAEQLIRDKSRDGKYRVMSTFVHPLTFGEFLALCLSLAMYLLGFAAQRLRRLMGLFAIPLIVVGIYITHTRSTLLALGVVLVGLVGTLGLRAIRQRRSLGASVAGFFVLVAVPIAALALAVVALDLSTGRTASEIGSSAARLTMLRIGSAAVLDQPLIGYGPGFAAVTLGILPGFRQLTIDNYYLSVALESGLPGLLVFAILLAYPVVKGLRLSPRVQGSDGARLAVLAVALAGFIVVKLVLSQPDNLASVFLIVAMLFVGIEAARRQHAVHARPAVVSPRGVGVLRPGVVR